MPLISEGYANSHTAETRKWKDIKSGFTHFSENDIGIAKITPCFENRKSTVFKNLSNGYGAGTTELHILRTIVNTVLPEYLLWIVKTDNFIHRGIQTFSGAVGQQRVGKEFVSQYLVPIPPHEEQVQIVAKLGEIFGIVTSVEQAKGELQSSIKGIKSKILDLAIRGKLVPQDQDDESADVLLERIRAEKEELIRQGKIKRDKKESVIFRGEDNSYYEKIGKTTTCIDEELPFELPDNWSWCRLGSICSSIQYGLSNSAEQSGTHRLLRITDIQNGIVDWDNVPFTTVKDAENYLLCSNDIVFARTGATVGKSYLITDIPYDSVYASYLIRIRLMDEIDPSYVYDFFNSLCYWNQITVKAVGIGQPNCNGTSLSNLLIPIPPTSMQSQRRS